MIMIMFKHNDIIFKFILVFFIYLLKVILIKNYECFVFVEFLFPLLVWSFDVLKYEKIFVI